MASDPLSSTTHKARTFLLGLSTAGFLSSWYNLKVRDIPFSGVDITVDEKLVPIMLTVGIGYFLASFVIYAIDDLVNQAQVPYLERQINSFRVGADKIRDATQQEIKETLLTINRKNAGEVAQHICNRCFNSLDADRATYLKNAEAVVDAAVSGLPRTEIGIKLMASSSASTRVIMASITSAWDLYDDFKKVRLTNRTKRYLIYRLFRIWIFDLALPAFAGLAALATMWWHLLPF